MIKRILIGLGGRPYTPVAIERAVTLAQRHEAGLTAVTMVKREQLISPCGTPGCFQTEAVEALSLPVRLRILKFMSAF